MSFSKMMELLQIKNKGKIIFVNAGNFYIAVGKDAVLVHKILDLKTTCMKPEICKAGFPINSLEKYTEKLSESKYSFIVYYFNQETEELEVVIDYNGKFKNNEDRKNINCYICKHSTKYYKSDDKYILAVASEDKYILAVARLYAKEGQEVNNKEIKEQEEKEKWYKINQKKKKTN